MKFQYFEFYKWKMLILQFTDHKALTTKRKT